MNEPFKPGLIEGGHRPKDFVLGGISGLNKTVRMPGGKGWRNFLPQPHEMQLRYGVDFGLCTKFAGTDVVEMILRAIYGVNENYSERALAILAEQPSANGDSLWNVAETIRKFGLVLEADCPWTKDLTTWEKFMACTPERKAELVALGAKWLEKYDFGYEFVYDDFGPGMAKALEYSPVFAATLYAYENARNADGLYYTDLPGSPATTHAVVLTEIEADGTKFIDDSYVTQEKHLAADFRVPVGMLFWITQKTVTPQPVPQLYYPPKNSYVSVADTGERLGYVGGDTIIKFATNGDAYAEMSKRNAKGGMSVPFPMVDVTAAQIAHLKRVQPNGQPV